jgi:hypothetical protein
VSLVRWAALAALAVAGSSATPPEASAEIADAFWSPSHNVRCVVEQDAQPANWVIVCRVVSARQSFQMHAKGRVTRVPYRRNESRIALGELAYGHQRAIGPFRCTSMTVGLACSNAAGHGWLLSRSAQAIV